MVTIAYSTTLDGNALLSGLSFCCFTVMPLLSAIHALTDRSYCLAGYNILVCDRCQKYRPTQGQRETAHMPYPNQSYCLTEGPVHGALFQRGSSLAQV